MDNERLATSCVVSEVTTCQFVILVEFHGGGRVEIKFDFRVAERCT